MVAGHVSPTVMREHATAFPTGTRGPDEAYSMRTAVVAAVGLSAAVVVAALAVLHPVAGVVGVAAVLAARAAARALARRRAARRSEDRTRTVCVPRTGVCVEA